MAKTAERPGGIRELELQGITEQLGGFKTPDIGRIRSREYGASEFRILDRRHYDLSFVVGPPKRTELDAILQVARFHDPFTTTHVYKGA